MPIAPEWGDRHLAKFRRLLYYSIFHDHIEEVTIAKIFIEVDRSLQRNEIAHFDIGLAGDSEVKLAVIVCAILNMDPVFAYSIHLTATICEEFPVGSYLCLYAADTHAMGTCAGHMAEIVDVINPETKKTEPIHFNVALIYMQAVGK